MGLLWKAYHTKVVHLSALFLTLLFSLASLVSCNEPPPPYTSINLAIPAAALQSPVKGPLPDTTKLNVGITFKIDPRLLSQADQQKLQPGQSSNLAALAKRLDSGDRSEPEQVAHAPLHSSSGGHPGESTANLVRSSPVQGADILRARDAAQSSDLFS